MRVIEHPTNEKLPKLREQYSFRRIRRASNRLKSSTTATTTTSEISSIPATTATAVHAATNHDDNVDEPSPTAASLPQPITLSDGLCRQYPKQPAVSKVLDECAAATARRCRPESTAPAAAAELLRVLYDG